MPRVLTADEEKAILRWAHANPEADIDAQILVWKQQYSCSEFSIIQVFVKEQLGTIKLDA